MKNVLTLGSLCLPCYAGETTLKVYFNIHLLAQTCNCKRDGFRFDPLSVELNIQYF